MQQLKVGGKMETSISVQPVGVYKTTMHSLHIVMKDFMEQQYEYGIVLNRLGKIEGFFSSTELLKHCYEIGFDYVEDIESLMPLTKVLNKKFEIFDGEPTSIKDMPQNIELYILRKGREIVGVIDQQSYLASVVKKQQFELYHFNTIFNAVPSGIMAVNIEGNVTMINPAGEKISGVPREKAIGQFITDIVPPEGLLQVLQDGQGHVEKYKVRKRWYISYREPIFDGKQLVGAVGVFDDISKIEKLSSELDTVRELVKENEALMGNSENGIAIVDVSGNILRKNNQFQQLYLSIINDKNQMEIFFQTINDVVRSKQIRHYEGTIGQGVICHFQFEPIFEEETTQKIIVRVRDITANRVAQHQMTQMKKTLKNLLYMEQSIPYIHQNIEMKEIANEIQKIAKVSAPVLIKGEIGTGRSKLAREIMQNSDRNGALFIEIDCQGKSYAELKKVLVGEPHQFLRLLRTVEGGIVYIKNMDYLPFTLQEQLANLIMQQSKEQSGSKVDVRFIASVSKEITFDGPHAFSERLYYLVNAMTVTTPALGTRTDDVKLIVQQFVSLLREKYNREIILTEDALDFIVSTKWKRNLLDIQECLEQFVVTWPNTILSKEQLVYYLEDKQQELQKSVVVNKIIPLKQAVMEVEKELIQLLSTQHISYRKMAKILEVNASTIIRKVKNIEVDNKVQQ
ncbi:sigma 54-interacting transcriptional regulator [Psychrobacillus soli]|uniref:PAS domain S-box protein n=1 Tax=Psychrobacillus soli TaxID=1543965 RepID=A0A544TKT9_9BACI|nr:sigma 54-interacting transcriptional regulator [Psychrobacillus soli]TQR18067.1 PAS domain S-box protein [Psychrobacillus soli]